VQQVIQAISQPRRREILRLVRERREGTRRLYLARPEALTELRAFLDGLWAEGLDRLKLAAEQEERRGRRARAAGRN
jgi:hypothetical protein